MRLRIFKANGQKRLHFSSGRQFLGEPYAYLIRIPWFGGKIIEFERERTNT